MKHAYGTNAPMEQDYGTNSYLSIMSCLICSLDSDAYKQLSFVL